MIDIRIRKYALIEFITQLESDSDLDAMEKVVATLKSAMHPPAPKTKTRKPKKEVPQSDTLTEKEAKNYILRYNNLLDVYVKIPKKFAERISKTIDIESIKKNQKMTREMINELADKLDIQEPIEELLEMLKDEQPKKKMGREYVRQLANEMNITESSEELLEMLKQ